MMTNFASHMNTRMQFMINYIYETYYKDNHFTTFVLSYDAVETYNLAKQGGIAAFLVTISAGLDRK